MPLAQLRRFPGNARRHADSQLKNSVRRFGQFRTIVVRKHEQDGKEVYTVLAGNGTADALEAQGHATARVEVIETSDDQEATLINLADNRLSDLGQDDVHDLVSLLQSVEAFDLDVTGWTEDDLAKMLSATEDQLPDPGDAEEEQVELRWGVIVDCSTENEQIRLLDELSGQGLAVRALMS